MPDVLDRRRRLPPRWRTGRERSVILGYVEDCPALVTLATNGWSEGEPACWLDLQAHFEARVELALGTLAVTVRTAHGKRARLRPT